jgi:hypothetical protein
LKKACTGKIAQTEKNLAVKKDVKKSHTKMGMVEKQRHEQDTRETH